MNLKVLYGVGEYMLALYMSFIDAENDRVKFEIIYNTYRKRMVLTADSVLHNKDDAEDAVHDTFIKIARNMKSIDEPESDRTLSYVLKVTKNNAINLLHKNKRRDELIQLDDVENMTDEQFFEKLSLVESYEEIVSAIRNLNDTYRDVMFYHFIKEMKIKDISDLLGKKNSAVQQQLIRGKKRLLEILEKDLRD